MNDKELDKRPTELEIMKTRWNCKGMEEIFMASPSKRLRKSNIKGLLSPFKISDHHLSQSSQIETERNASQPLSQTR